MRTGLLLSEKRVSFRGKDENMSKMRNTVEDRAGCIIDRSPRDVDAAGLVEQELQRAASLNTLGVTHHPVNTIGVGTRNY